MCYDIEFYADEQPHEFVPFETLDFVSFLYVLQLFSLLVPDSLSSDRAWLKPRSDHYNPTPLGSDTCTHSGKK